MIEVRLVPAVLDGIRLQWVLDPATEVEGSTYSAWRRRPELGPRLSLYTTEVSWGRCR